MKKRNWDQVYRDNGPRLLAISRRYVGNTEVAQDIVHDVFIKAIDKEKSFSGQGSFEGWLSKIAVNASLQYIRNNKKVAFDRLDNSEKIQQMEAPAQHNFSAKPLSELLGMDDMLEVIDDLPEHHKAVFNLYVIEEYRHHQIGEMLGISEGTSKSHLARGRKKIQSLLLDKAKTKEKERHEYLMWLFFTPKGEMSIDKAFKSVFSNNTIPVTVPLPSVVPAGSLTNGLGVMSTSLAIKLGAIVLIGGGILFIFIWSKKVEPLLEIGKKDMIFSPKEDSVVLEKMLQPIKPVDQKKDSTAVKPKTVENKTAPKKTIIKKTVIVKKQIIIVDSTNEERP